MKVSSKGNSTPGVTTVRAVDTQLLNPLPLRANQHNSGGKLKIHENSEFCIDTGKVQGSSYASDSSTLELSDEGLRERTSKIKNGTDRSKLMKISLTAI